MTLPYSDAIRMAYTRALDFEGRASRAEFWPYVIFYFLTAALIGLLFGDGPGVIWGLMGSLLLLINFIVLLSVSVRRLHDAGHSGWWLLLGSIPVIGQLILLIWFCQKSEALPNEYGDNPLDGGFRVEVVD